jgi:hypothetical protein
MQDEMMERVPNDDPRIWLELQDGGDSACGYDPSGWERSVWILNPIYENASLPSALSHDEVRRIEEAAGVAEQPGLGVVPAELMERAVLIGGGLGWSEYPGEGWERRSWRAIGARLGVDPLIARYLDSTAFPMRSWPVNVEPPTEGSLDVEQYRRLVDHLSAATPALDCLAFYALLTTQLTEFDFDENLLFRGPIGGLTTFCDDDAFDASPSNIWAEDESWFVYTDYDLWATKVSGNAALIEALLADEELETAVIPRVGDERPPAPSRTEAPPSP